MNTSPASRPSLDTLGFDILIIIFKGLDALDVVRVGMTNGALHELTKEHRIWWDQTRNWFKKNPVLKLAASQLNLSHVDDLRNFAVRQSRMRLRWGQGDYEPVERYISCEGLPDRARAWLMPGGNSILCASYKGDLTLHRISPGPHPSVEPVPFVSYSVGAAQAYHDWMALLRTTSPYPIFAYASGSRLHLISIDHGNGRIFPEQVVSPFIKLRNPLVRGHSRVLIYMSTHPLDTVAGKTIVVIHLDYPGTTLEILLPPAQGSEITSYDISLPSPSVVVALFRREDSSRLYELPDFSTLKRGVNTLREPPRIIALPAPSIGGYRLNNAYLGGDIHDQSSNPPIHLHINHDWDHDAAPRLLTLRVDPSAPGLPVTEVLQLITSRRPIIVAMEEGVIFFRGGTVSDPWIYLVVPVGEPEWDRMSILKLRIPAGLSRSRVDALTPSFDLASGRMLFINFGNRIAMIEIL